MHRFTEFQPQIAHTQYGPEPSLFDILSEYYGALDAPDAAHEYIAAWLELEREDSLPVLDEVRAVLRLLDSLAEVWDDEAVFKRCRDRLRNLLQQP